LETFSTEFKRDCLAFFLNDSLAAKTALTHLPDDFFDFDPEYAIIFRAFKEFLEKYQDRPSRNALIDYITDWCVKTKLDAQKTQTVLNVLDVTWKWDEYNPAYVRDKLYDAIKAHEVFKVARQIDSFIDKGNYDDLVQAMAKARSCVDEEDPVIEYWEDTNERMTRIAKRQLRVIPTGMAPVDNLLSGGLVRGGIGMILGGSGRGKTAILGQLALKASLQGFTAAYVTLEAGADEIMRRCDAHNSGVVLKDIALSKIKKKLATKLFDLYTQSKTTPGPLYVQYYPTKTIGVSQIDEFVSHIREVRGHSIDLLVVDYFDLLKMAGNYTKKYEALEENIEILRGVAGKYDLALWTASQVNRSGLDKEVVDMDDIASGFGKVFPLDLLISISQTKQERAKNVLRFHFAKNRQGPGGAIVYVEPDFERMQFTALTDEEAEQKGLYDKKAKASKMGQKQLLGPTTSFGTQGP
jgi:hypothetical protein